MKLTELISLLIVFKEAHGDLPCVYEAFGVLSPAVTEIDGRKVCDLVAQ